MPVLNKQIIQQINDAFDRSDMMRFFLSAQKISYGILLVM